MNLKCDSQNKNKIFITVSIIVVDIVLRYMYILFFNDPTFTARISIDNVLLGFCTIQ